MWAVIVAAGSVRFSCSLCAAFVRPGHGVCTCRRPELTFERFRDLPGLGRCFRSARAQKQKKQHPVLADRWHLQVVPASADKAVTWLLPEALPDLAIYLFLPLCRMQHSPQLQDVHLLIDLIVGCYLAQTGAGSCWAAAMGW